MAERRVTVGWQEGLHARPAAMFSRAAMATGVRMTVRRPSGDGTGGDADGDGAPAVDAASMLGVMALGAERGDEIVLASEGDGDADHSALDRLARMVAEGLDELPA
ncbi:HPr family phosphocarrier protein [Streptomyces sp. DSM 42041]|uniref:Phosphocarrier protein HPr n=1 Tax=Streptomyces hazeniae TaxID=3075538 RepID=A0ABU2NNQ6_9ACTN|nr:HPr family phosphocarrier protein [Streptomyces sp. DSM 42041]MDT0378379.1 HPr family phosphocarrier protein [Streptomyces sp. DSM 42041]